MRLVGKKPQAKCPESLSHALGAICEMLTCRIPGFPEAASVLYCQYQSLTRIDLAVQFIFIIIVTEKGKGCHHLFFPTQSTLWLQ